MTPRIQEAIDIFLDAINEGTLAKGICAACAVGNLVCHGMGGRIEKFVNPFGCDLISNVNSGAWGNAFSTYSSKTTDYQKVDKSMLDNVLVKQNIEATKFSAEELIEIEYAFETNTKLHSFCYYLSTPEEIRKDQISGLKAVVEVMLRFDDCNDSVKEVFTTKAELIPIV